jgi:acyl carrier protein
MEENEIRSILIRLLKGIKEEPLDTSSITDKTILREGLGLDSLQTAETLLEIKEQIGITINDEEALQLKTIRDLIKLIQEKSISLPVDVGQK